jgi:hypothetical protein
MAVILASIFEAPFNNYKSIKFELRLHDSVSSLMASIMKGCNH